MKTELHLLFSPTNAVPLSTGQTDEAKETRRQKGETGVSLNKRIRSKFTTMGHLTRVPQCVWYRPQITQDRLRVDLNY